MRPTISFRALSPSVFHQDPRIFRKQDGSVVSRFMYGISRPFVTRTDDGQNTLNTSYLGGLTMTVALSNAYYPECNRNAADSAARYGEDIGIDAAVIYSRNRWADDELDAGNPRPSVAASVNSLTLVSSLDLPNISW
jgi:hypothetical protein